MEGGSQRASARAERVEAAGLGEGEAGALAEERGLAAGAAHAGVAALGVVARGALGVAGEAVGDADELEQGEGERALDLAAAQGGARVGGIGNAPKAIRSNSVIPRVIRNR